MAVQHPEYWLTSQQAEEMFNLTAEEIDKLNVRHRGSIVSRLDLHRETGVPNPWQDQPRHPKADV